MSRNPLFIKSEFSQENKYKEKKEGKTLKRVAILYSSSQNSLRPKKWLIDNFLTSRNPLFIKSEFSYRKQRWNISDTHLRVAILYSSSQNSLAIGFEYSIDMFSACRNPLFIKSEFSPWEGSPFTKFVFGMSQSFIHQVRILSKEPVRKKRIRYFKSQSFIHQVRILSRPVLDTPAYIEIKESQSFIHQVRILSCPSTGIGKSSLTSIVAILYSSSQNSLRTDSSRVVKSLFRSRNPLFIKSEFSHRGGDEYNVLLTEKVAILYSSSQNSLLH